MALVHAFEPQLAISGALCIKRNPGYTVTWWPTDRMEVLMIRDALVLAILDVGAPFLFSVLATDAMGANEVDNVGFAVVGTEIAPNMAANI